MEADKESDARTEGLVVLRGNQEGRGPGQHESHENHKMSRRQLVLVIAGSIVALLIVAYSVNHLNDTNEFWEEQEQDSLTEQDFDRWGMTCMEVLGTDADLDVWVGCVEAHKKGLLP